MTCDRKIGPFDCCSVVQGDCLELMKQLPDGCVDAVITDPPYGIGLDYDYSALKGRPEYNARKGNYCGKVYPQMVGDDKPFDPRWFLGLSSNVITWGADHYYQHLPEGGGWLIWDKRDGLNSNMFADCEMAWSSQKKPLRIFRHMWLGYMRASEVGEHFHQTQKPIALMAWCIEQAGNPETILDPYCGSGTTLVAAKKLGRHFLGFEISEAYCQIARERLARIDAQPSLFDKKPEQLSL